MSRTCRSERSQRKPRRRWREGPPPCRRPSAPARAASFPKHRYIFEYVPNRYSVTEENLRAADAIEIKVGQSAKPGMGGHLPGAKVTTDIAAVRGFPPGEDIHSPASFPDIRSRPVAAGGLRRASCWHQAGRLGHRG